MTCSSIFPLQVFKKTCTLALDGFVEICFVELNADVVSGWAAESCSRPSRTCLLQGHLFKVERLCWCVCVCILQLDTVLSLSTFRLDLLGEDVHSTSSLPSESPSSCFQGSLNPTIHFYFPRTGGSLFARLSPSYDAYISAFFYFLQKQLHSPLHNSIYFHCSETCARGLACLPPFFIRRQSFSWWHAEPPITSEDGKTVFSLHKCKKQSFEWLNVGVTI